MQNYVTLLRISEELEKVIIIIGDFRKKHWVDFYHCRVDVYTHCYHIFMFKQKCKSKSEFSI